MENDEFFREFTLRICGSLDLGEALQDCLPYVKGVMPADEMIFTVYDAVLGALEVVAIADGAGERRAPFR